MADLDVRDFPDRELTGHGYGNNDFGALTRSKKLLRLLQTVARPIFSSARGGLNPISGFCFPLFSTRLPRKIAVGVENNGI